MREAVRRSWQAEEALIRRHIETEGTLRGEQDARLVRYGVPIWALIGHLRVVGTEEQVADDYEIPLEAVEAAVAFYRRCSELIDARIRMNAG